MLQTKTLTLNKKQILALSQFVVLVGIATIAPLFHFQPVTGPVVNAVLFVAAVLLGNGSAILVGLIPSLIALSCGLLPSVLAPTVPFIMLGNTLLILVFSTLQKKNYWLAMVSASVLKFVFLFSTSSVVANLIIKKEIAQKAIAMLSWPQLLTALGGGIIAYLVLRVIKK